MSMITDALQCKCAHVRQCHHVHQQKLRSLLTLTINEKISKDRTINPQQSTKYQHVGAEMRHCSMFRTRQPQLPLPAIVSLGAWGVSNLFNHNITIFRDHNFSITTFQSQLFAITTFPFTTFRDHNFPIDLNTTFRYHTFSNRSTHNFSRSHLFHSQLSNHNHTILQHHTALQNRALRSPAAVRFRCRARRRCRCASRRASGSSRGRSRAACPRGRRRPSRQSPARVRCARRSRRPAGGVG